MSQITLADFERRVWGKLENNTLFYPQLQVDRLINEAARTVNLFTGFSQDRVPVGLTVQNWTWYCVPTQIVFPMKVYLENKELIRSPVQGTSQTSPRWFRGSAGDRVARWVPVGSRMFALSPADAFGGKFLEVLGVTTPALLVNPGDSLTLEDDYAELIVSYAFMNLVLKEGGRVFSDAAKGYQSWLKRIGELQMFETKINPRFYVERENKSEAA